MTADEEPAGRLVELVVCDEGGAVLGAVAPFPVDTPWWQEVDAVVAGARTHAGLDVVVLRLLEADRPAPHGGRVRYLAQLAPGSDPEAGSGASQAAPALLAPPPGLAPALAPDPRRQIWAEPGGPGRLLAWARDELTARDRPPSGPAVPIRSWNLSALWTIPTAAGPVWLKAVPPMFAHEPTVLVRLGRLGAPVPPLLAGRPGCSLLDHLPGEDGYRLDDDAWLIAIGQLVGVQRQLASAAHELVADGVPDQRGSILASRLAEVVDRYGREVDSTARDRLADLVREAPDRLAAADRLGPPATLVHGDFHPGNLRAHGASLTLLDWGDCYVGQPLFDLDVVASYRPDAVDRVVPAWLDRWSDAAADVDAAWAALAPVAAARPAVVFAAFVDAIEPSEQPYHCGDIAPALRRAAAVFAAPR